MKNLIPLFFVLFLVSCQEDNKLEAEIATIPMDVEVHRFDQKFAKATPETLPHLKDEYPYLFPENIADSVWVEMLSDTLQNELESEVNIAFADFNSETEELENAFRHFKYYFPEFITPKVVTVISEVDYRNKVIAADDLLLIGLDNYLGEDHKFYVGIQDYIAKNLKKERIVNDVVEVYGKQLINQPKDRTFLAQMVYYGKILYLKDKILPESSDALKIGYTEKEMDWANTNEEEIWRYFIENELLYDTDSQLQSRFINLAPFSKFRLQLDNESPPQLGQYIGWQIVRQFAEKNEAMSLRKVLNLPAKTIFENSSYRPK
ncbi:gliding motility lipoprotein GldB [Mesonia sp. K7]|uniref:gliding motility lipoprotein GldB n=1 Tax=Mesonia sp. K7 TaxID=2218606 RepID=UPI000DAA6ECB|nr:gliding motility lipoprotein GldB [Mesonia sp. K7]PZD78004.1 gliding motility lipoprotein GldB [Mesonia sp. K7]